LQLAIVQVPAVHVPVAFAGAHILPHIPQCEVSVCVLVSQPFIALPSQLPKPALQLAIPQVPIVHEGVPFMTVQARLHIPQCEVSVCVLVSQPFMGLSSQS
jgi:hypothetical protein